MDFPTLQKLRDQEAELASASTTLESTIELLQSVKSLADCAMPMTLSENADRSVSEGLDDLILRASGYHRSVKVLQERASKLIDLVSRKQKVESIS